jgi:hypothetical protein
MTICLLQSLELFREESNKLGADEASVPLDLKCWSMRNSSIKLFYQVGLSISLKRTTVKKSGQLKILTF